MRAFCFILPLLLLNIFSSAMVNAVGGDNKNRRASISKRTDQQDSVSKTTNEPIKKGSLADLFEMETNKKRQTLAELMEKDSSINAEEIDEFAREMSENEQLIEAVFEPQQNVQKVQETKVKGTIIHALSKKLVVNKMEEKLQRFQAIKKNDPVMCQIMEQFSSFIKQIKSGQISEVLFKEYLRFAVRILAKRQRIPLIEIVPVKKSIRKILAEWVKLHIEQKRGQNSDKTGQNGDKKGQKSEEKSRKTRGSDKRMLQLLLSAMDNTNGTANLAIEFAQKERKRRKKRVIIEAMFVLILILVFACAALAHEGVFTLIRNTVKKTSDQQKVAKTVTKIPEQNGFDGDECSICLSEYEKEDKVRVMPACLHKFHSECVQLWFENHNTCPMCRAQIIEISDGKAKPIERTQQQPTVAGGQPSADVQNAANDENV